MARLLSCTLVLGCAALLGLPTSASAGTILVFGQVITTNFVSGGVFGRYRHIDHPRGASPNNLDFNPDLDHANRECSDSSGTPAFETFVGVTSSTAQVGDLTRVVSRARSSSPKFPAEQGREHPDYHVRWWNLEFAESRFGVASDFTAAQQRHLYNPESGYRSRTRGNHWRGTFSLSFANITPPQSGPFTNFTAQNSGVFSTTASAHLIPEPASIVMALWAVPLWAVLGMLGYRPLRHRYKSSKA